MVRTGDRKKGGNNGGVSRAVGCIKATKGPWVVRRKTRYGGVATTLRYPSAEERGVNRERERRRRALTSRIFAGVRAHGNYPKQADSNDLLKALCDEAGWMVDDDGNVLGRRKSWGADLGLAAAKENEASETLRVEPLDESDLKLSLSLPVVRTVSN